MRMTKIIHCEWKLYLTNMIEMVINMTKQQTNISRIKISNITATHGEQREEESGPGGDVGGDVVVCVVCGMVW